MLKGLHVAERACAAPHSDEYDPEQSVLGKSLRGTRLDPAGTRRRFSPSKR